MKKIAIFACALIIFAWHGVASATVTVTTATGGSAISADTTGGSYTALTGPTIQEGAFRDFPASGTFILNAPTGFQFATTANSVTATITRTAGTGSCFSFSSTTATPTASAITFTLNARDGNPNTTRCQVVFSGIQVRPTSGTPLASGNITKSGTASVVGITNGTTNLGTLTEVVGAKNKVAFTTQPSATATTSVDFTTKPVIKVQDQFANTLTTDNASTITLTPKLSGQTCAGTNGTGTLTSTPASGATVTGGVMTYAAMQYSVAEDIQICAASAGANSASSSVVSVKNPVPATTLISPTSTSAGGPQFTLTVHGTNFIASSQVHWNGSARTTTYISATQLTATILASDITAAGTASVTVVTPTPGGGTSNAQTFTITTITPTKFVILPPTNGTVDAPIVVTVEAQDNAGNIATTYQPDVTLNKTGSATGGGLVNIVNGVGTTTIADTVAETVHLTLSDTQGTGLNVSSSQDVIFAAGATLQLSLPTSTAMTAGTRAMLTVTRKDQYDNLKTVGSQTYYLYSTSAGTKRFYDAAINGNIVTTVTIQNGSSNANVWYYDELAGNPTVTVSDNATAPDGNIGVHDATSAVTVSAAAPSQFSLTQNTTMTAGTRLAYTVTRKDQFNNLSTVGTSTVYLYSTSAGAAKKFYDASTNGNVITSIAIGAGASSANVWYYDELAGSVTVTASDNPTTPDGATGIVDATNTITVTAGATGQFTLNNPGNMTAGTRLGYTVTRKDAYGNLTTTGSNTVYLYSNSTGGTKAFYDAASGGNVITSLSLTNGSSTANFWYYDEAVGTWTITASDNATAPDGATGIADGTQSVTVNAAPIIATRITIMPLTNGPVGSNVLVTVRAEDNNGNLDTTYNDNTNITLHTSGSATPQNGVVLNIQNGVGTTNITDTKAETVTVSLTRSASSTLDVSSTQTVTFTTGAVAQFILNNPGNMTAGTRLGYTVTRKDTYGNLVTAGSNTVYLYSNSTGGLGAFYAASSGGSPVTSIAIGAGASSANVWYYEGKAGTWTVSASDNATAPDGSSGIADGTQIVTVSPAQTSQFSINNPGNMTAGTRLGYTVTRKDSFGNLVTAGIDTFYMYTNSSATSSAFYNAASGGSAITSRQITGGNSTAQFWYYDEAVGTWTITASDNASGPDGAAGIADASQAVTVTAIPIVATRFTILKPTDAQVGTNTTVTIRAEDNNGNLDTTVNSSVTLVTSGSATGGGVVTIANGVGTRPITDAVPETVVLSLRDTASTTLNVASTQTVTFTALPPAPSVGGGATFTSSPIHPTVIFSGVAFPGAKLTVVGTSNGDVPMRQGTSASASGTFSIRFSDVTPGIRQYFLSVADANGRLTQTKVYTLDANQQLTVRDVFVPPTIGFAQSAIMRGGFVGITGYATPGYTVNASIDGAPVATGVTAGNDGRYTIPVNTLDLALGSHTARAWQTKPTGEQSDSSTASTFLVTNLFVPQTDLNGDGAVNASDLSIFLAKWLSKDPNVRKALDFNGDGVIDIQDLSIFARTLGK